MSIARVFSLIGDSNIRNHMNPTNCRDRPLMSAAKVHFCSKMAIFPQSLSSVSPDCNVCVLSCISNFICDSAPSSTSVSHRVEPVISKFFELVKEACIANPDRRYLLCPPMYRMRPIWYRDGLPDILTIFSTSFAKTAVTVSNGNDCSAEGSLL